MTTEDVAKSLQIPVRSVYSLVDQGVLPARRLGKRLLRFKREEIEAAIERSARN
jgi:excisionase family DNA binding protein